MQTKSSRRSIRRLRGGGRHLLTAFSLPVLLALPFGFAVPQTAYGAQAHDAQLVGDDPQPSPQRPLPTNLPATLAHPGSVLVAFLAPVGVTATHTRVASVGTSGAYHANTAKARTDVATLNQTLSGLGTTRITHLFAGLDATALNAARARAMAKTGRYITDFTQVYQVSFDPKINDGKAANELARSPLVASASPDFILPKPVAQRDGLPAATMAREAPGAHAAATRSRAAALAIPNYSYVTDGQSYHDAASNDLTGAAAMLRDKLGQTPGQGETVLNISLGRIADDSTVIENGQRYLEQRGYPRIATYTSNAAGDAGVKDEAGNAGCLDPLGTNVTDPNQQYDLTEPMLDFSVMAPPPNGDPRVPNPQTPGQLGNILGAAYGADFRLVNPFMNSTANFVAAFLCGGDTRRFTPTIMTASIGDGAFPGFSGDYFFTEETLIHDAVQTEVQGNDIFVSISAGDGQTDTRSAAYPNGIIGSTEVTTDISKPVDINEFDFTDPNYSYLLTFEPQFVVDSGANDAGGDTLNDIFNNSPYNTAIDGRTRHTQHTTETRWTGQQNFNSGYGSRTNLSAPADDVLFLAQPSFLTGKATNPNPIDDEPGLIGGTSASAPEIAAAAAVVRQTARLLGHPLSATDIRAELIATARPHAFPAFDLDHAFVGPELDLTRAVADLFTKYGSGTTAPGTPSFVRMTVAQRKAVPYTTGFGRGFYTDTPQDPSAMTATIDLSQGLTPQSSFANETLGPSGDNLNAPITFGADGEFLPAGATFSWSLGYNGATTAVPAGDYDASLPYLRLLPSEIFTIVGQPVTATVDRVVTVTVTSGSATTAMAVTFKGQSDATYTHAVPPSFNPIFQPSSPADGVTFSYDLTGLRASSTPASGAYPTVTGGELIISDIDRALPRAFPDSNLDAHGCRVPLTGLTGSITLTPADSRVAACLGHGTGTYGIALRGTSSSGAPLRSSTSAWTPLRYAPALEQHPDTPKVQAQVSGLADFYPRSSFAPVFYDLPDLGIGGSSLFTVTYTTTAVAGAQGSLIEISAPTANFAKGVFLTGNVPDANKFTNPYGDRLDGGDNYGQSGSVYHTSVLPNTAGSITLDAAALGLTPQAGQCDSAYQVRVFATDGSGHIVGVASNPSIIDPGYYNVNNSSPICTAPNNGGGGGGAPTPELGSGELLATGLVPLLAALFYRNRCRARRGAPTQDEEDNLV